MRCNKLALCLGLLFPASTCFAQMYTVTDLGPLSPTAINNLGQVVGDNNGHAFMWTKFGGMRDLGTIPGGTFSHAAAINDFGTVTGTANGSGTVISFDDDPLGLPNQYCSDLTQPFVWTNRNGMQGLGTFASGSWWYPPIWCLLPFSGTGINARGQLVGYSPPGGTFQWGFLWTSTDGMIGFGGSWPPTFANGVSNTGQIVGQNAWEFACVGHATWWKNPTAEKIAYDGGTDLGTLGGVGSHFASSANGVNDLGQIVGWATTGPISWWQYPPLTPSVHAVLWTPSGAILDLGTLPGDTSSAATKTNLFGQVIGSSGNTVYSPGGCWGDPGPFEVNGRPFIWSQRSGMRNLNSLIASNSGWVLNKAADINIWGQIVGSGTRNGQPHGFLLTPRILF